MECEGAGQCLPFLAYVRRDKALDLGELGHDFLRADSDTALEFCGVSSASRSSQKIPKKLAIRTGDHATALFQADGLRMTASVRCLERGSVGEIIRVQSQDGHIFRARILGPTQLEVVTQ
jgi:hypothetical protein